MNVTQLLQQLCSDSIILTPNQRLSAVLLTEHHQLQTTMGKTTWPSLNILPLTSWLQRLWMDYHSKHITDFPLLLTPAQEKILWASALVASHEGDYLFQITETAAQAQAAWGMLKLWQVPLTHPELKATEDSQAFYRWASQVQAQYKKRQWLDSYTYVEKLAPLLPQITLPRQIILYGFTEIAPLYQHILTLCQQLGTQVIHQTAHAQNTLCQRTSLANTETEILTMARWAKGLWQQNPQSRIACIVPTLDTHRDQVLRAFAETFATEKNYSLEQQSAYFNFSAGKALSHYPVIQAALQLLHLHTNPLPMLQISSLLRSPFLAYAEQEMTNRASFDSVLRRHSPPMITLATLLSPNTVLSQHLLKSCPQLHQHLCNYLNLCPNIQQRLSCQQWAELFSNLLATLGWPGERSLVSAEYQAVQRFLSLLTEFATFGHVLPAPAATKALDLLTQLATNTIFQAQTSAAPIQILGLLEAAGLPFDYTWVMGMDDNHWPPPARPNPFIPLALQRQLNMPHASAERELNYALAITQQLRDNAGQILFSYSRQEKNHLRNVSPLLRDLPEISSTSLFLSDYYSAAEMLHSTQTLETLHDEQAPAWLAHEQVRGGANLFKQQAACPFKAFAELRLQARELDFPSVGLKPQERGIIIHKALELIWQQLGDQTALLALTNTGLTDLIHTTVTQALRSVVDASHLAQRYLLLEQQRLQQLLTDWLNIEKNRPHFTVIAQEMPCTISFAEHAINFRVDRIDALANGDKIIIDYKTGKSNPIKGWFSERPDEPQLPLYCLSDPNNTVAILFAQVNNTELTFKGISQYSLDISGSKALLDESTSWAQQLHAWQLTLTQLAHDFFSGKANVDPKDLNQTCHYCTLQTLCRVNEK